MRVLPVLLAFTLASCGGSDDSIDAAVGGEPDGADPGPDAMASTCTLTLSGGVSGTFPCSAVAVQEMGATLVSAQTTEGSAGVMSAAFALWISGDLMVRDYPAAELTPAAAVVMNPAGQSAFSASAPGEGTIGTLRITAFELTGMQGEATVLAPHGSFSATLVGLLSGGTVTMTAEF